ncbi:MAG TPA: hypothetical protein VMS31_00025 [Pyrinomonadaceae bacterium]|nr:hypothetical protein [Pyrinomonadaceae bacterium]
MARNADAGVNPVPLGLNGLLDSYYNSTSTNVTAREWACSVGRAKPLFYRPGEQ